MYVALLLNSRPDTDPANAFVFAMQNVALDVVTNTTYAWQNIDQF